MSMTLKKIALLLIVVALISGCTQKQKEKNNLNILLKHNLVKYAKNFKLIPFKAENSRGYILYVKNDKKWNVYILYNGTKPNISFVKNPIYIKIPVKRLIVMSSTHLAMLEAINATNCLVGFMYGGNYKIYFKDVAEKLKEGKILNVGSPYNPDYEKILKLHPDLVVIYVAMNNYKVAEKLKELNVPFVIDSEWKENTPLGRVEWVKFFGAITGKESIACKYFNRIVENITKIKEKVKDANRPTLVWALIWHGRVYMPSNTSYVANMVRDAGCTYLGFNGSAYTTTNIANLIKIANNADYFIYASYFAKNLTYIKNIDPRLTEIKAFKDGRIYNITPDYWQLGYIHTDRVIEDLAAITHPNLFRGYKPHYFVRLK